MIVAVFAMFGIGYYVGMQYSDNKSTVSNAFAVKKINLSVIRSLILLIFLLYLQQMTFGLVSAIGIMIVEMILFIRRATQMEGVYEKAPTALEEANAQIRSGALLTSNRPSANPTVHSSDTEAKIIPAENVVDIPVKNSEPKKTR